MSAEQIQVEGSTGKRAERKRRRVLAEARAELTEMRMEQVLASEAPVMVQGPLPSQDRPKYFSGAAKAAGEAEKRKRLRAQIAAELSTPLGGCMRLTQEERNEVRSRVHGSQLHWRGVGT